MEILSRILAQCGSKVFD